MKRHAPTPPQEDDLEPPADSERGQQGVQALETGLQVLAAFAALPGPMRLSELAQVAGVHPAKAHRYLVSFVRGGYVIQNADGLYQLGPAAVKVGLSAVAQMDYVRLVAPLLTELSVELSETAFAAIWSPEGPMILRLSESWRPVTVNVRIGAVLPLLTSAAGCVFTAWHAPALTRRMIEEELSRRQPSGVGGTDWETVEELRSQMRSQGVAAVRGDYVRGVNSVAAPIFDYQHQLVAALGVVGLEGSLGEAQMQIAAERIRSAAAGVSSQLGYAPGAAEMPDPESWA